MGVSVLEQHYLLYKLNLRRKYATELDPARFTTPKVVEGQAYHTDPRPTVYVVGHGRFRLPRRNLDAVQKPHGPTRLLHMAYAIASYKLNKTLVYLNNRLTLETVHGFVAPEALSDKYIETLVGLLERYRRAQWRLFRGRSFNSR